MNATVQHMQHVYFSNDRQHRNSGLAYNVTGSLGHTFNGFRTSALIGLTSPGVLLQGRTSNYGWSSVSVTKDVFHKATISLQLSNPFAQYRRTQTEVDDAAFSLRQQSLTPMRQLRFSLSYRFGKLQSDIVRKKRGIVNDDLKSGK